MVSFLLCLRCSFVASRDAHIKLSLLIYGSLEYAEHKLVVFKQTCQRWKPHEKAGGWTRSSLPVGNWMCSVSPRGAAAAAGA